MKVVSISDKSKEKKKGGGYFIFVKDYMDQKKEELGDKFVRKDLMEGANQAWKNLDA